MIKKTLKNQILLKSGSLILFAILLVSPVYARTIYVDINGGADYTNIQEAINAANSGDIVQVAEGIYNESIQMKDGVNLIGAGADVTSIDGNGKGNVITIGAYNIPSTNCDIKGFTITGGRGYGDNAGIRIQNSQTSIISNNLITGNAHDGIRVYGGSPAIINNTIVHNGRNGIMVHNGATPTVKNNIIVSNTSAWPAYAQYGWGLYTSNGATIESTYNNVWDNNNNYSGVSSGVGDISEDSLFIDASIGDYQLQPNSPCIDAGDPSILDLDGSRSDMGAFGGVMYDCGFQGFAYERKPDGSIGDKLAGVNITFTSEDGTVTEHIIADANGYYRIPLMPARYVVTANCSGYEDYTTSPGFFVCTGDGYQTGNFFLKKIVLEESPDLRIVDFTWTPENPVAVQNCDFDLLIYFKCEGEGKVDEGFNVSFKINGKIFKDVAVTYNPIPGTGWKIKFGEAGGSDRFTSEFFRACVPGENEIEVMVDYKNDVDETDENNNRLTKKINVYDTTPPELVITNPKNNDKIKNSITVSAIATDNVGVAKVRFYIDSSLVYTDTKPPYEWAWKTHSVKNGEHIIKVIACDTFGNTTEKSVKVLVENDIPKASIKIPKDGKRICGNAVTIMAEVTENTLGVLFQYMYIGETGEEGNNEWINISTIDKKKPYAVYWNTSGLVNGKYYLRAVAHDKYGTDPEPSVITVFVDDVNWDIHEDGNPEVDPNTPHRKHEKFSKEEGAEIVLVDGTQAIIPPDINVETGEIEITILIDNAMSHLLPPEESSLKPVGIFRDFKFTDGTRLFNKNIKLVIPYPDEDNDGIIDGTDIQASTLRLYWLNEKTGEWIPVDGSQSHSIKSQANSIINGNFVEAEVDHFTIFALLGYSAAEDLKEVIVYPNPYKPNSGLEHNCIYFDGLTENANVEIYTITGRLVNELTEYKIPGKIQWDVLNSDNEKVASGVYLYVVRDGKIKPARGKFAVIR